MSEANAAAIAREVGEQGEGELNKVKEERALIVCASATSRASGVAGL